MVSDLNSNRSLQEPYVKNHVQALETVRVWIERFEKDYFTRRRRNPKSETTWKDDYLKVFGILPSDQVLTVQLLTDAIAATEADSRTRKRFVDVCSRLAKFAGLEVNFKPLQGSYSSSSVIRTVPSDQVIAQFRDAWFDAWNLADGQLPSCTGKDNSALGNRVTHAFKRYGCPFDPYDLRHPWAVRTIAFRVPTTLAARMMGHSVDVHERIYQQWITEDFEMQVIGKLMEGDRPLPPAPINRI